MKDSPVLQNLRGRLAIWSKRLADAQAAGDDPVYAAIARAKVEELTDAIATREKAQRRK